MPSASIRAVRILRSTLAVFALAALGTGIWLYVAFRQDLDASRERLKGVSQIIDTRCGPIEYAEAGSGEPLLIAHGAGGGFDQGMEFAGPLSERGFRVVAVSRFGYLRTPNPTDPSAVAQADAYACLLDALGISRVAMMGGSAGAPSAMQFAIRQPERCSALVLVVPLAYKPPEVAASVPPMSRAGEWVLTTMVGSDFAFWLTSKIAHDTVVRMVLATPPEDVRAANGDEQARVDRILERIMPISLRAQGLLNDARVAASLPRYELERIKAPTLVISVRDDLYGTFASAEYTASQIPGARFVGYDTGGHTWVGHHQQLLAEIGAFLSSVPPQGTYSWQ
jgi:pimeloyl-ACP methyl ester carboxylesterase